MTVKSIVIKNLKYNLNIYLIYLLSSTLSIFLFFLILSLKLNRDFMESIASGVVNGMLITILFIITLFSIMFISYCYMSLIIARAKEFGLYLLMGMSNKQVNKIIISENVIFSLSSLIIGVVSGGIFSYFFFLIALKVTTIRNVSFYLNPLTFVYTILIFSCIFIIATFFAALFFRKKEVIDFVKIGKKKRTGRKHYAIVGFIGLLLIIVAIYLAYYFCVKQRTIDYSALYFCLTLIPCILGIYLVISHLGFSYLKLIKKNKTYYYKNILHLSQISYRFYDYKFVLFSLSLLSGITIFLLGLAFTVNYTQDKITELNYPSDIYIEYKYNNDFEFDNIWEKALEKNNIEIYNYKKFNGIYVEILLNNTPSGNIDILSESTLNTFNEAKVDIKKGEALVIYNLLERADGPPTWFENGDHIALNDYDDFKVEITDIQVGKITSGNLVWFVIDDKDFDLLHKICGDSNDIYYVVSDVKGKEKEVALVNNLNNLLSSYYNKKSDYSAFSKFQNKTAKKQETSVMLFTFLYLGFLLFIATGCVIYFKITIDREHFKDQFNRIGQIGITSKEVKKVLSKSILPIFLIPCTLGGILGGIYLLMLLYVEISIFKYLIVYTTLILIIYILINYLFYIYCRNSLLKYM